MVARDGIEPPTPAFSGLLIDKAKWFRMRVSSCLQRASGPEQLGWFGLIWDDLGSAMFPYCSSISTPIWRQDGGHEGRDLWAGSHRLITRQAFPRIKVTVASIPQSVPQLRRDVHRDRWILVIV